MKEKIFGTILNLLIFWVVVFEGIQIQEGVVGYVVCGGIYGIIQAFVEPLIAFFTLPVKAFTVIVVAVMLGIITFFVYNFALPFIDFSDGAIVGLSSRYYTFPVVELGMMGNVLVGGMIVGLVSALLRLLHIETYEK